MKYQKLINPNFNINNIPEEEPLPEEPVVSVEEAEPTIALVTPTTDSADFICDPNPNPIATSDEYKPILTIDQVNELMQKLDYYRTEIFDNKIPVKHQQESRTMWNIPLEIIKGMWDANNRSDVPEVLNPAILVYMLAAENPYAAMGYYMQKIQELILENQQYIDDDALSYVADLMDGETSEDEEDDHVE